MEHRLAHLALYQRALMSPRTSMPSRRLEDRIRELCARAVYTKGAEWEAILGELRVAIQEHLLRLANLAAAAIVAGRPEVVKERRRS